MLKYADPIKVCSSECDLQQELILHLEIRTVITATSLESTIINYIYSYSP